MELQSNIITTIIVNIVGTFLNNQEKRTKYLKDKELTNIKIDVEESMIMHALEIRVTAYTINTFSYCKEYDSNEAIVLDDYMNNERIGFKVALDYRDIYNKQYYEEIENMFVELIPPEFKKYELEILCKFREQVIGDKRFLRHIRIW